MRKELIKRILLRGPNWIGDAVMCEPAVSAVRHLFPDADISLLVKPAVAELFKGHPAVTQIVVYDDRRRHAGWLGKWVLARDLRRMRFQLAILFQNAFEAALITFLAGIPNRYGYATDGRRWLLSDPVRRLRPEEFGHQVHYYMKMLEPLGYRQLSDAPRLFVTAEEERAAQQRLTEFGISDTDVVIGMNPGSTYGGAKRWLPERFAETADRLAQTHRARVVIVGARGEEGLGRMIAERMHSKPLVLSGHTSIRELMGVINRCQLFVTNDTGPMHIAAAFGVPVVAVFGPTDWRTTSPFGEGHALVRQPVECAPCLLRECPIDHRCMTRVTVDEVHEAATQQLETSMKSKPSPEQEQSDQTALFADKALPLQGVTIFLDRDGTTNRDTGYLKTPDELQIFPGAIDAVARLKAGGAKVVMITNQSGVGRGLFSLAAMESIHAALRSAFAAGGARFDGLYYCPHHPDEGCRCRKPGTELIERAVADLGLDLSYSYVIGDQKRDVELARRIGARSVLVTTGPTSLQALEELSAEGAMPDCVAAGLSQASQWILTDAPKVRQKQPVKKEAE